MLKRLRWIALSASVLAASAVWTDAHAHAQRSRTRIAGRTGNKTSPTATEAERRRRQANNRSPLTVEVQFARFPDAAAALNLNPASLRGEFDRARSLYPKLTPAHFIAVRLLTGFAGEARPDVQISAEEFVKNLQAGKGYRTTLRDKGFTNDETERAMRRLRSRMDELDRFSG